MSTEELEIFKQSGNYIQSLDRGLQVIQAFSQNQQALTISDVSKITGLSRPTARRILLTLEHLGFAESNNNVFSLTARTLSLGYAYLSSNNIWSIAHPFMRDFVESNRRILLYFYIGWNPYYLRCPCVNEKNYVY